MHSGTQIAAVLADVDGTLVTKDKVLTERAIRAVNELRERGIVFTITSGRPPFGMRMLVEPLGLTMPMAAFNGGVIVLPDLSVLDERLLPEYLLPALLDMIEAHGMDVFIFRSNDWCVRSLTAPRVDREAWNLQQAPLVVRTFDEVATGVVKVVGVSEDQSRVAACEAAVQQAFGTQVSAARSTPFYLDVTHPTAHKGVVIERLSRYLTIPLECIAAIGDQPNDVLMFERAGLSIAMGNASEEVKRRATLVTTSHADEGFANAVEQIILPRAAPSGGSAVKPTGRLHHLGQSLWLDGISRHLLTTHTLERYIDELSVTGVTSNTTIFAGALRKSSAYDAPIAAGARRGSSTEEVFFDIALEDLTQAADLLRSIYERSAGVDGWVSLEAAPRLAHDAAGTLAAAKALFARAKRPNLMVVIPGTPAGLSAIEDAIFAGIPVHVTLLFSREQYLAAAEAFLRGIERRIDAGLRPDVSSVASVGVSRWDAAVAGAAPPDLRGRLGIAMAQRTYKAYRDVMRSPRWQRIYNSGARPQRLVWEIARPKDPEGSDIMYTSALTAQFTVMAIREKTLHVLAQHGEVTTLLRADGGNCEETLARARAAGIDLYALALQLQEQGTSALTISWNDLMSVIESKVAALRADARVQQKNGRA